jgi:GntR family transcriptional regulator/MocR family aminotransferase
MSKRISTLPHLLRPRAPGEPVSRWLVDALQASILDGRLRPGARLPATRDLAREYGVARGTVVAVFEELTAQGYLRSAVGSGTYVHDTLPADLSPGSLPAAISSGARPRAAAARRSAFARRARSFGASSPGPARAFRTDLPALDLFPTTLWAQVAGRRLRRLTAHDLRGCESLGYPPLRAAVADYLRTARGVRCDAAQIAIVSGAQEALDLVARLLLSRGGRVCMEDPGYIGATRVFEAWGARITGVPVDAEGMRVPSPRTTAAEIAYVTPAHQFPLGVAMSLPRRLALLDWARTARAWIFEDDYDSEFRFSGRPLPALQGLDTHGVVIFSEASAKSSSLRCVSATSCCRPAWSTHSLPGSRSSRVTRRCSRRRCSPTFLRDGHFGRHIRRMREIYAERWTTLRDSARSELAGALDVSPIEAGLQTPAFLAAGVDDLAAARAAADRGVETTPLSRYARRPLARGGLQLGFAPVEPSEIRRGVRELARALEGLSSGR